jgi:hypothetical protein
MKHASIFISRPSTRFFKSLQLQLDPCSKCIFKIVFVSDLRFPLKWA